MTLYPVLKEALACSISTDSKSGQFKVRTLLSKNRNSGRFLGARSELMGVKEAAIPIGMGAAGIRPGIQVIELDAENGRLQRIHAAVGARDVMEILLLAAMDADHSQAFCHSRIIRGG